MCRESMGIYLTCHSSLCRLQRVPLMYCSYLHSFPLLPQPNQSWFRGVNNTIFIINNSSSTFIPEFFFFLPLFSSSFCKFFLKGTWVTHRPLSSSCSRVLKENRECAARRSWNQLHGVTTQSSWEQLPNLRWLMEKPYRGFSSLTWFRSLTQPNEEQMVPWRLQKHFSWNFGWIMQIGF